MRQIGLKNAFYTKIADLPDMMTSYVIMALIILWP